MERIDLIQNASRTWRVKSNPTQTPRLAGRFGFIEQRGYELVVACHFPGIFTRLSEITTGRVILQTPSKLEMAFAPAFINEVAWLLRCVATKAATRQLAVSRGR